MRQRSTWMGNGWQRSWSTVGCRVDARRTSTEGAMGNSRKHLEWKRHKTHHNRYSSSLLTPTFIKTFQWATLLHRDMSTRNTGPHRPSCCHELSLENQKFIHLQLKIVPNKCNSVTSVWVIKTTVPSCFKKLFRNYTFIRHWQQFTSSKSEWAWSWVSQTGKGS